MPLRLPYFSRQYRRTVSVFLLLGSALFSSCRSEQVAFQFRPSSGAEQLKAPINRPTPASGVAVPTTPAANQPQPKVAYIPVPIPKPTRNPEAKPSIAASVARVLPVRKASRSLVRWQGLRPKAETTSRPQATNLRETGHLVLGIALVAAGVVAGLLLGGWLGLGVGAVVVILGYYFLGLAFGGKHAWLEVFQEFFNM